MDLLDGITLSALVATWFRAGGLFVMLPLGWDLVSMSVRLALSFAMTILLLPLIPKGVAVAPLLMPLEFMIGAVLAIGFVLVIEAASFVGEMFDTARGQNMGVLYDPLHGESATAMGILCRHGITAILLSSHALIFLIRDLRRSMEGVPVGGAERFFSDETIRWALSVVPNTLLGATAALLPIAVLLLTVEFGVALVTKSSGGVQIGAAEGAALKSLIAFGAVTVALLSGLTGRLVELIERISIY